MKTLFSFGDGNTMTRARKSMWIYWLLTIPFVATMIAAGGMLLAGMPANVEGITHLGYPVYICKILGIAKVLGGIALLQERFRTLKEWAYAGYTFNLLGAAASHAFSGSGTAHIITPIVILAMVIASYRLWTTSMDFKIS